MDRERHRRPTLTAQIALTLALLVGPTAIAVASPGWHPSSRAHAVVWVTRTGVVRPRAELAAAKPAPKPATEHRDRNDHGNARDAHGPAAPDPILCERTSQEHQALPQPHDDALAAAQTPEGGTADRASALGAARATQYAALAALFHDAHAPPKRA